MNWKSKIGLGLLISCTALTPALNADAATTYQRSKQHSVASRPYYAKSNAGSTYQLKGSAKKTTLKANHALKNYRSTTWMKTKTMTLKRKGKSTTYYYVRNAKNGATGWVKPSYLKAGKNFQGQNAKRSSGRYKRAKNGKYFNISGNNNYVKFGKGTTLSASATYTRSKTRTIYKSGKAYQYDYITSGKSHGWTWHNYLKTAPKPKPFGTTKKVRTSNGISYYQTSGNVLSAYSGKNFSTVNVGAQYVMPKPASYGTSATFNVPAHFETKAGTISRLRSTADAASRYSFKTAAYLPIDYPGFSSQAVFGDPQSAAFSKDDRYLYVMYNDPKESTKIMANRTGWVIRYDWAAVTRNGAIQTLRQDTNAYFHGKIAKPSYMTVGPKFQSGHVQSLALNPKTNELWFIKAYKDSLTATAQRLNQNTLKPDASVNFKLNSNVHMGSTLTFDNAGNAYFWTQTASTSWAPKNSVKFYKGQLGTNNVHFKLVMQGLRRAPGGVVQSASYNPRDGRFYVVSDDSIFSVPTSKIGNLRTSDVSATNFSGNREFEGLMFKHNTNAGYLLTNKGPEIMQMVR